VKAAAEEAIAGQDVLPSHPCPPRATWWSLLGLVGLVAATYGQTTGFALVWDDHLVFQSYPAIRGHVSWWNIFTSPQSAYLGNALGADRMYRPILAVTILTDRHVWGLHPGAYHLTNTLAHLAAVLLLWRLAWWLTGSVWAAFATGALLAVHPSAVGAVAFLSARMDVFVGTGMAAVFLLLRACPGWRGKLRAAGALLCFGLALACKETAMTIPVMLTWAAWVLPAWFGGSRSQPRRADRVVRLLPFWFLLGVYVLVRQAIAGGLVPLSPWLVGLPTQLLRALVATGMYARMTLIPQPAMGDIRFAPPAGPFDGRVLLGLLVVGILVAGLLWLPRHHPPAALALGWYAVALVPVSNIIPIYETFDVYVVERALYPALVGWCLFLGVGACAAGKAARRVLVRARPFWPIVASAVLGTFLLTSVAKVGSWRDDVTLWTATLAAQPDHVEPRVELGYALIQDGRLDEAQAIVQEALTLSPANAYAVYLRGRIAELKGDRRGALRDYERAISLSQDAFFEAVLLAARLQERDRAGHLLREAARHLPKAAWPQIGLGWYQERSGRADLAQVHFDRAARLEPASPGPHWFLARLLASEGRLKEAEREYHAALALDPSYLPAHRALAWLAEHGGRLEEARERWRNIVASSPAGSHRTRAMANLRRLEAVGAERQPGNHAPREGHSPDEAEGPVGVQRWTR
jgi:tetratricopeptide (TPR) repeat protein